MTHAFDEHLALRPGPEGQFIGRTHPAYANMIGPFGGYTAAQALHAVLQHPQRVGEPVSLTVNFCAALADAEFSAVVRPVRTNRSTQHWTVEFHQGGAVALTATAFTAVHREAWGGEEKHRPSVPPPAEVDVARRTKALPWLQQYEFRFLDGAPPREWDGREHPESKSRMWVRDFPPRPLDHAALAALADTFFPRIFLRRALRVPISTVSMTVYFHATAQTLQRTGTGCLLGEVQGHHFHKGFFDHTGHLWNEAGELLATTHQVVYYKA